MNFHADTECPNDCGRAGPISARTPSVQTIACGRAGRNWVEARRVSKNSEDLGRTGTTWNDVGRTGTNFREGVEGQCVFPSCHQKRVRKCAGTQSQNTEPEHRARTRSQNTEPERNAETRSRNTMLKHNAKTQCHANKCHKSI